MEDKIFQYDLAELGLAHNEAFMRANPFPHLVLRDVFRDEFLNQVLDEFPNLSEHNALSYQNKNEIKLASMGNSLFGERTTQLVHALNAEHFLKFLNTLTGIEETLFSDPYLIGGGFHEIKKGGLLKIHADFNKHLINQLDRRVNVLVYLNKNWDAAYGGNLELWDKNMQACIKAIPPIFNTMVIFTTTDYAYHGHPDKLNCPENESRKSLAFYYYSKGRPTGEIKFDQTENNTTFKSRKHKPLEHIDWTKNTKTIAKKILLKITPPIIIDLVKMAREKK